MTFLLNGVGYVDAPNQVAALSVSPSPPIQSKGSAQPLGSRQPKFNRVLTEPLNLKVRPQPLGQSPLKEPFSLREAGQ